MPFIPDLVLIVKPEGITSAELAERGLYFLRNGASIAWILHPHSASVDVCSRAGRTQIRVFKVNAEGFLNGGELLPSLKVAVTELFE